VTQGPPSLALGVDVGGTKVLGVAVDPNGRVVAEGREPTPQAMEADGGERLADTVASVITTLAADVGVPVRSLPIGVGLPGMMGRDGVLLFAPNLRSASGADLVGLLEKRLGGSRVAVANDADCAALAEQRLGAARGHDDVIVVTLGTGIGGGLIVGGELVRGGRGFAGEVGHMVINVSGPACPCGARGCWERYASGSAVGRLAREAAQAGRLEAIVASAGGEPEAVRGEHVTAAALAGDRDALALIDQVGWWLARGLANLVHVLDPTCIVIGGGLSEAGALLVPAARRHLVGLLEAGDLRPPIDVVAATFGQEAGSIGASLLAREVS